MRYLCAIAAAWFLAATLGPIIRPPELRFHTPPPAAVTLHAGGR